MSLSPPDVVDYFTPCEGRWIFYLDLVKVLLELKEVLQVDLLSPVLPALCDVLDTPFSKSRGILTRPICRVFGLLNCLRLFEEFGLVSIEIVFDPISGALVFPLTGRGFVTDEPVWRIFPLV